MNQFLLLARSVRLAGAVRRVQTGNLLTRIQADRPLTIWPVIQAKRSDSTNEDGSDRNGKKKGFLERAKDKMSAMSRSESHSRQANSTEGRQTRSMARRGSSHGGDFSSMMFEKTSGKLGSHRALNSVKHDKESHRFILDLGGNEIARIDYRPIGKNTIEMYHTEVPEHLRGRGIGKTLAKGALECASRSNLKLKVTCDYLEDYVKRFATESHRKLIAK